MTWKPEAFEAFQKIGRMSRGCTITEKIDGTNAQIYISDDMAPFLLESGREVPFMCGSRNRYIFPEQDNNGFAGWAFSHAEELLKLGPGHHYGEWWGGKIQRGYGKQEKTFSLFNVNRWREGRDTLPACLSVVPLLYEGPFGDGAIFEAMEKLRQGGSIAAPGFMDPEGIVIYHHATRTLFKKTLKDDEKPKGSKEDV